MKHSLAYAIALASVVVALPQKAHPRAEDPRLLTTQGITRKYVSASCNETEKKKIEDSFQDAQLLASALNSWVPNGKNQDVMNMYMGNSSSSRGDPTEPSGANYREIIQNNTRRAVELYGPPKPTDNLLFIMCNKDLYMGNTTCPPTYYAWTGNNVGTARTDHYMTFCPLFFNSPTLEEDVKRAQNNTNTIKILNGFDTNTAATFFHESFHLDKTVGDPYIGDDDGNKDVYGANAVADTAAKLDAATTMLIAECYTMAGLAIYYRDTLGLTDFPRPGNRQSPKVIRKKLDMPAGIQAAADPNDPNSTPSGDWIPLLRA